MDRPIYLHIPKTGGSTMRQIMMRNVDRRRTFAVGSDHATKIPWFASLSQEERDRFTAVLGHIRYGIHRFFSSGTPQYFTFLRHPVERTLSAYSYTVENPRSWQHHEVAKMSFLEYLRSEPLGNRQTIWLMGYLPGPPTIEHYSRQNAMPDDHVDIVKRRLADEFVLTALLERYDASLLMLQDIFGWPNVYYLRANTTQKRLRYKDLSADEKRELDALTGPDFEIYDWAKARFDARLEELGDPFQARLKAFQANNVVFADRLRRIKRIKRRLSPKRIAKAILRRTTGYRADD